MKVKKVQSFLSSQCISDPGFIVFDLKKFSGEVKTVVKFDQKKNQFVFSVCIDGIERD